MSGPLLQQALSFYQLGQADKAAAVCRNILQRRPAEPDALHILGNIVKDQGHLPQALQYFQQGLRAAPGHVHLLNSTGLLLRKMGYLQEAQDCFEQAIEVDPGYFQACYNLANLCRALGDTDRAKRLYRQVLRIRGNFVDALANLANILEEEHRLDEAQPLARKAVDLDPNNYMARLTLARVANRRGRFDAVLQHLQPLVESGRLSPVNYSVAAGLCARAREKLGDYSQAFDLYQRMNDSLFQMHAATMKGLRSIYAPESVENLQDFFGAWEPEETPTDTGDLEAPVFLVGFPRSGTTLLDQILSAHSQIAVLEEKENLEAFYRRFPATHDRLSELASSSPQQLQESRDQYWRQVEEEIEVGDDVVLVDKLPLNVILLGHISRLFPSAKIIFALRDPRDVVFSCFQQHFGMNQAMFQFLKLETAVNYYDQVMSLARIFRERLSIRMHFVRYESVISDFDEQVSAMLEFLDLNWEDPVRDFHSVARERRISTPSAQQVVQPLYTSSIGKWRHYREFIGERFEPLQEWVDYWGYA